MSRKAEKGDNVSIHYSGKLENDAVFDTTAGREPFQFAAGSPDVIRGVSEAVIGMAEGEKKTVEIPPKDAYGDYDSGLIVETAKDRVPEGVKEGSVLSSPGTGQTWVVKEIKDETVMLDGNHVLAGRKLIFDIELVSIG